MITVEVAYAKPDEQKILVVKVPEGATIEQAIHASGILTFFPEINLEKQKVGVFSKSCLLSDVVYEGERIEIYRPLLIDPKDARRKRVRNRKAKP
jgi:putative ubiquitin-RnfH superfamily antitoxin RatB of RatAB toxin-antitoxin module